jgi:ribosomal protein S6--L-glutamate ligase
MKWPIEVTLTNRDSMQFRMLLGRTAMENRIIVSPDDSYLQGKPPSQLESNVLDEEIE